MGVGIKQNVKFRDAVTQNKWRKEHSKLLIFREIAKWRQWRHALRPTAKGSCHGLAPSFFDDMTHRRRQNLTGYHQATLMVDRKSAIYICLR